MNKEQWHLSKSVPIALFSGLIFQGALAVGAYYTLRAEVTNNIVSLRKIELKMDEQSRSNTGRAVQLGRLSQGQLDILRSIDRLNRKIDGIGK